MKPQLPLRIVWQGDSKPYIDALQKESIDLRDVQFLRFSNSCGAFQSSTLMFYSRMPCIKHKNTVHASSQLFHLCIWRRFLFAGAVSLESVASRNDSLKSYQFFRTKIQRERFQLTAQNLLDSFQKPIFMEPWDHGDSECKIPDLLMKFSVRDRSLANRDYPRVLGIDLQVLLNQARKNAHT